MPSEYDILLPYSQALRRIGRGLLLAGAFVAGVVCTALVIAIPFRHVGHERPVSATAVKGDPAAAPTATNGEGPTRTAGSSQGQPGETAHAPQPCENQTWPNIDRDCLKSKMNLKPGDQDPRPPVRMVGPDKPADPTADSKVGHEPDHTTNGSATASDSPRQPNAPAEQPANAESAAKAPATEAAQNPAPDPVSTQPAQNPAPLLGAAKKPVREPPPRRVASSHDRQNPTTERTATSEGTGAPSGETPVAAGNGNPPTATQAAGTDASMPTSTEMAAPRRSADRRRAHRDNRAYARRDNPGQSQPQNRWQGEQSGPTWTRGEDRDYGREFVDAHGVRHIILPREWNDRSDVDEPPRTRRVIIVRPTEFDDD